LQVKEYEKYYVFEGDPGTLKMDILREASSILHKVLATVMEKAEVRLVAVNGVLHNAIKHQRTA